MKILKLRFKNIHSLKGEHIIDFEAPPLEDAGLFAITGPTGAGKSSILDVITLALFNKIPRFALKGTENISKNEIEKMGSVMTHFTDHSYAEIEYSCHDKIYRSTWQISKARTGNLRDYEMTIATLPDGQFLDLKKSEVPSKNEELLGLKYEQFIRSILLSQGDFARLLKSDDKERAQLLENITDTHIYRDIGKKIYEVAKEKTEEIKILRLESQMLTLLSKEILLEKENLVIENRKNTLAIDEQIKVLAIEVDNANKKRELQIKENSIIGQQKLLTEEINNFEPKSIKLQRHNQLKAYVRDIVLWENAKKRINTVQQEIVNLDSEIVHTQTKVEKIIHDISDFVQGSVTEQNISNVLKDFESTIIGLDNSIKTLTESGKISRNKLSELLKDFDDYDILYQVQTSKSIDDQYQMVQIRMGELNAFHQSFTGSNSELNALISNINQELIRLTNEYNETKSIEALVQDTASTETAIGKTNEKLLIENQSLNEFSVLLEDIKNKLSTALKQKEQWLKMASLDEYRDNLLDGEPCPLCGSVNHPYSSHIPTIIGTNELYMENLKLEQSKAEKSISEFTSSIAVLHSNISTFQDTVQINTIKIQQFQNKPGYTSASAASILAVIESKKLTLATFQKEEKVRSEKAILHNVQLILKELIDISIEYKQMRDHRNRLYIGVDIKTDVEKYSKMLAETKEELQTKKVTITNSKKEYKTTEEVYNGLDTLLLPSVQKLGYKTIEESLGYLMEEKELLSIQNEKEILTRRETELTSALSQVKIDMENFVQVNISPIDLEDKKNKIVLLQAEKDTINQSTGAILNELEQHKNTKKQFENLESKIKKAEEKHAPFFYLNHLIGDATGNKYAKFAQNVSLKQLINMANKRLIHLTDRYILAHTDIEDDFRAVDLYQGNTERSVKTLSGGETFIVSLALALSLSDMASKNVKLESLFIDEGFGTLDNETLETALITLEKLQSESNRTIGIISHVESLKERIAVQIKVHKNNFGHSNIEIVSR